MKKYGWVVFVLMWASLSACGGDSSANGELPRVGAPAETAENGVDLSAARLSTSVADPLDRVRLVGLPDGARAEDLYADIYRPHADAEEGWPRYQLPLFTLDEEHYLLTPLFDEEGETVVVVITDGESKSEVYELTLNALPAPRKGAIDEVVDAVDAMLQAGSEELGHDYPDEWQRWRDKGLDEMPHQMLPLMLAWHGMLDEENDQALINQKFSAEETELLERILAASPLIKALNGQPEFISSASGLHTERGGLVQARAATSTKTSNLPRIKSDAADLLVIDEYLPPIDDAAQLAGWLDKYNRAKRVERSLSLFDDTVGAYLTAVALAASAPAGPKGAALVSASRRLALGMLSNVAAALATGSDVASWFMPCCLIDLEVTLDPADGVIAFEDALANQVSLQDARVTATSEQTNLTRKALETVIDKAASKLGDKYLPNIDNDVLDSAVDSAQSYSVSALTESFFARYPMGADIIFLWDNIDLMVDSPQKWLDVETDTRGSTGSAFLRQDDTLSDQYAFYLVTPEAFSRQEAHLRFSINTDNLEPANSIALTTEVIKLDYIDVEFDPDIIWLEEGETRPQTFTVTANHSSDPLAVETDLTPLPAAGSVTEKAPNGDKRVFEYTPPADFPDEPVIIRACSTSEQGIRAPQNNPPERCGALIVGMRQDDFDFDITITPESGCVHHGESIELEARAGADGPVLEGITWSTDAGSVDENGVFTAPLSGSGTARVVADFLGHKTAVELDYGDCACQWTGSATAGFQLVGTDRSTIFIDSQNRLTHIDFHSDMDIETARIRIPGVSFDLSDNPVPLGETGTFPAKVNEGVLTFVGTPIPVEFPWEGSVTINEHEAANVESTDLPLAIGEGARRLSGTASATIEKPFFSENAEPEIRTSKLNINWSGGTYWVSMGGQGQLQCKAL